MKNPFQFGRELGLGSLVDRQKELAAIEQSIRDGNKLFLIGPRRFGKTSILKTAADRLSAKSAIILRLDAESYPTIDMLVGAIVSESAKALKGGVKRVGEQIQNVFSILRPELDYSVQNGEWSVKFGVGETRLASPVLLVDALNGLEKLANAQPENRPVGLIIDEFQRLIEIGGRAVEGQIRSAIQRHSRVGYVFAGSKTRMLRDMVMDGSRPFYRLGTNIFLGPIPREDFSKFLHDGFDSAGFSFEAAAIKHILDVSDDVPYNVQWLANHCWTVLHENGGPGVASLTTSLVDESLSVLVRQQDPFYAGMWSKLTAIQQRTLIAVVTESGANLLSFRVLNIVGKGAGSVRKALTGMMDMTILREERAERRTVYRFEDPFFDRWMKMAIL
jgi:AAA+ ATPase superfamily predicted ATPase